MTYHNVLPESGSLFPEFPFIFNILIKFAVKSIWGIVALVVFQQISGFWETCRASSSEPLGLYFHRTAEVQYPPTRTNVLNARHRVLESVRLEFKQKFPRKCVPWGARRYVRRTYVPPPLVTSHSDRFLPNLLLNQCFCVWIDLCANGNKESGFMLCHQSPFLLCWSTGF